MELGVELELDNMDILPNILQCILENDICTSFGSIVIDRNGLVYIFQ